MSKRVLLGIIGLIGLGLWVSQGCAGGPAAPYRVAQVQKKAVLGARFVVEDLQSGHDGPLPPGAL